MSKRHFLHLSYDGTSFHGWQIQPNAKTIQETINEALSTLLREEINVVGCGRTDTGVHARSFYAHFDSTDLKLDTDEVTYRLNRMLPPSIAIKRCFEVNPDLHARFSATSRSYEYLISSVKNPFAFNRMWEMRESLDIDRMNQASALLKEYTDFSCFSKSNTQTETNDCDVTTAHWTSEGNAIRFEVSANRFLRNMVRAIVGTMVEVGKGKISIQGVRDIIESKNRSEAGTSVPAHGLYLIDVQYPEGSV